MSPHIAPLFLLALATFLIAACAVYHPAPIKPAESQKAFMRRDLRDPEVLAFTGHRSSSTQPSDTAPTDPWTFDQLARAAIYFNPDLAAVREHLGTVRAGEETAGEMPNPSFTAAPSIASNAGNVNPWINAFTFDIPIETAGKREDRIAQAKALTQAATFDLEDQTWRTRSKVRDAIVQYLVNERVAALYQHEVESRGAYAHMLESRLAAGEAARAEVDTARIDLITDRQAWRAAQGAADEARVKLSIAIGVPVRALDNVAIAWPRLDAPPLLPQNIADQLQDAGLLNRLDIRRTLSEYDAAEASLKLEIARQYPDLHIGPGYTFDQGQHEWQLGATLVLPILNQNGGAIAEASGRRNEAAAKFLALQAQVISEVESALVQYASALRELNDADAQVSTLNDQVNSGNAQLNAGEMDRLTVTGLEIQRDTANRLRLEAIRKAQLARGALEDALERPLPTAASATQPATQPEEPLK